MICHHLACLVAAVSVTQLDVLPVAFAIPAAAPSAASAILTVVLFGGGHWPQARADLQAPLPSLLNIYNQAIT